MSAVCHRCGGEKPGPFLPCSNCKHIPSNQGRAIAWLFSSAHLSPDELQQSSHRIRAGEAPDPSAQLLAQARHEVHQQRPVDPRPLSTKALLGIGIGSLLLTPLTGLAMWWGLRQNRPIAAAQALRITTPIAAAIGALWIGIIVLRLFG